jgi:polyisoprenoid-binding protein YceI
MYCRFHMAHGVSLLAGTLLLLPFYQGQTQERNPFTTGRADSDSSSPITSGQRDSADAVERQRSASAFKGVDSVVYQLASSSRLQVKTGKAGLFGFAGHTHLIQARAFTGRVVYYPKAAERSHFEITIVTKRLEVLTPPDTAEIRKVTEAMRTETLQIEKYPEIKLVSRKVTLSGSKLHVTGALTIVDRTREVPLDLDVRLDPDSIRAKTTFAVKQTDFGIKPYSGGPAGTVKVADKVTFYIDALAVPAERVAAGR